MTIRWKDFEPNIILAATDMADVANNGVVKIDTASDLTNANLANVNMVYQADVAKVRIRIGAGTGASYWSQPFNSGSIPAVITSGGTKTSYTGNGTNGESGANYEVYTFTSAGSLVTASAGYADVLLVGGGGPGRGAAGGGGGGGAVIEQNMWLPAGTLIVGVGAGGTCTPEGTQNGGVGTLVDGSPSYVNYVGNSLMGLRGNASTGGTSGTAKTSTGKGGAGSGAGSTGNNGGTGVTSYITGTAVAYGGGGGCGTNGGTAGTGTDGGGNGANWNGGGGSRGTDGRGGGGGGGGQDGGGSASGYNGGKGIVIVRVKV